MVRAASDAPVDGARGGRGQLLLAGSVVLAVAILGVAAILNGAMYTDAAASGVRSADTAADAETYERTVEADLRRLVNGTDGEAALRTNVSTYADRLALVAADAAGAVVVVRLVDVAPSRYAFEFTYDTPDLTYRTTITVSRTDT